MLPALSSNRGLQRLVSEYYDTIELSSSDAMPPPPARPRVAQQASSTAAAVYGAETCDGDGTAAPVRRPSVGNGGIPGKDQGPVVGSLDPDCSRHGSCDGKKGSANAGSTGSARLRIDESHPPVSVSPSDPRPQTPAPARELSGPADAVEQGAAGAGAGAVNCAAEGGAVATAGSENGKDNGACLVDSRPVSENGPAASCAAAAAADVATTNRSSGWGAVTSGASVGSDSGVVPVEAVSVSSRGEKEKGVGGENSSAGVDGAEQRGPAALLNGA